MQTVTIDVELRSELPPCHNTVTGAIRHLIHQLGANAPVVIEIPNDKGGVDVRTVESVRIQSGKTRALHLRVRASS